jgi:hypothetical protein
VTQDLSGRTDLNPEDYKGVYLGTTPEDVSNYGVNVYKVTLPAGTKLLKDPHPYSTASGEAYIHPGPIEAHRLEAIRTGEAPLNNRPATPIPEPAPKPPAKKRGGTKTIEEPPAPEAKPIAAPATLLPNDLQAINAELEALEEERKSNVNFERGEEISQRMAMLNSKRMDAERVVRRSGFPLTEPAEPVTIDPSKDKYKFAHAYFTGALNRVKDAWTKAIRAQNANLGWEDISSPKSVIRGAKPEEFKDDYIRIEVPGDGKFLVLNDPKNIGQLLKGAKTAFAKPPGLPSLGRAVPRAPRELSTDALLAHFDAEEKELREQLKSADEGEQKEHIEEQLRANAQNRYHALHGEDMPETKATEPAAKAPEVKLPKVTAAIKARPAEEVTRDYGEGVAANRKASPEAHDLDHTLAGLASALDKSGLEPDPEAVLKGRTTGRSPWFWEVNKLFGTMLGTEKPESFKANVDRMEKYGTPTVARKVETDKFDWWWQQSRRAEDMRQNLEDGDYGKEFARAEKFAQDQRRAAQIIEALKGETKITRAARAAADETDLQVAQKRAYAEGRIAETEQREAGEAAEKAKRPYRRAERMRPLSALKVKPKEAWEPDRSKGGVTKMGGGDNILSDGASGVDLSKATIDTPTARRLKQQIENIPPTKTRADVTIEALAGKNTEPLTFEGYQDEGGDVGEVGYFTLPDGKTLVGVDPQRMRMMQELFGHDVTFTGKDAQSPILVRKNGESVGVISPMKIEPGHVDLETARKTMAVRGKGPQKDVAMGARARRRTRDEEETLEPTPRPAREAMQPSLFEPSFQTAWDEAAIEPYRNFPSPPPTRGGGRARGPRSTAAPGQPKTYTTAEMSQIIGPLPAEPSQLRRGFDEAVRLGKSSFEQTKRGITPELVSRPAEVQANLRRKTLGEIANRMAKIHTNLKEMRKVLDPLSREAQLGWLYSVETGARISDNPALNALADSMRGILDPLWEEVRKRKGIKTVFENYMAHGIWDRGDAEKAANWYSELGLRSLEGRKGFLKQRKLPTIKDGIDRGLTPKVPNPADMMMLKAHEMLKFIHGHDEFEMMKTLGIAKYAKRGMKFGIPDDDVEAPAPWGKQYARKGSEGNTFREAVDSILFKKLNDFAASLGIRHYREKLMTDGTLGHYDPMTHEVVTKIATPLNTLVHEIGHALDYRHGPEGKTLAEVMTRKGKMAKELRALADLRYEDNPNVSQYYKDYVRKGTEKIANLVDAFVNQPDRLREVAPESEKFFREYLEKNPQLKPLLDIRPSLVRGSIDHTIGPAKGEPEFEHVGTWYIPRDAARIIENSLSPGISNAPIVQLFRRGSNSMVQARLGMSLRHVLFTAFEPSVSLFGKGIRQIARGQIGEAIPNLLRANPLWIPAEAIKSFKRGNAAIKEFFENGPEGAENSKIFEDVTSAGGRVQMDKWYQNNAIDEFRKRWREGSAEWAKHPIGAVNAAVEAAAYPVMQKWVPALKMGVFLDNYATELQEHPFSPMDVFDFGKGYFDRLKPEWHSYAAEVVKALHYGEDMPEPPEGRWAQIRAEQIQQRVAHIYELSRQAQKQEVMQRVWDSVDNRLGQLVYDNLFWNRTMKEIGQMGLQSLGWNMGSWKEAGGGAADLFRVGRGLGEAGLAKLRGRSTAEGLAKARENTTMKASYVLAYAPVVGMMGLVAQYMMTHKLGNPLTQGLPKSSRDWWYDAFFPHNGKGDERVSLPGYHMDAYKLTQGYGYGLGEGLKATAAEIAAKENPLISTIAAMINNRDFYGTQVYDPEDPRWKEAISVIQYGRSSLSPYSFTNMSKLAGPAGGRITPDVFVESILGISRAPSSLAETPAMHLLGGYARENRKAGAMTKIQYEHNQLRRRLAEELKSQDPKAIEDEFKQLHEGKITAKDIPVIRSMSTEPWMVHVMESSYVTLPEALHAYEIATPEEKKLLRPGLLKKGSQLPPDQTLPIWDRWKKALADNPFQGSIATPMTSLQPLPAP